MKTRGCPPGSARVRGHWLFSQFCVLWNGGQTKTETFYLIMHGRLAGAQLLPAKGPQTFPTNYAPVRAGSEIKSCSTLADFSKIFRPVKNF